MFNPHPFPGHNYSCRKISRKHPQNQDKPPTQKENVPGSATKPGQTATANRKCPGKRHKTRTNRHRKKKMSREAPQNREEMNHHTKKVTGMSPLLPLADLGIVCWSLAVFFEDIQLGTEKGICRMLHQRV